MTVPNSLTILRIVLTPVFMTLLLSPSATHKQVALIIFFIAAVTDWYDGWVARKFGYDSRIGKFLDPLADKILSITTLFAFVSLGLVEAWMVWIIFVRDAIITALRSTAEWKDKPIITSKSAQAKTFGEFIVMYYILIIYVLSTVHSIQDRFGSTVQALLNHQVLFGMMLVVLLSTIGTGVMYLWDNRKFISELYDHAFDTKRAG
jgi:CDP-diacylglycerol--glycerol-3-phosphate 3-phosphatidyltransferase